MPAQGLIHSPAHAALTITLAFVGGIVATAALASSSVSQPQAACIAYDVHILTLIEDHGLVDDTDPETLREAAFTMLKARAVCRAGNVEQALALYDTIPLGYVPITPFYRILMR